MSFYEPKSEAIGKFVAKIANVNSTIVIPDLQRPYIWSPMQVIKLVDSIFRNWPFGTLLTWDVTIGNDQTCYIPNRGFWAVEDRTGHGTSQPTSHSDNRTQYTMVLDGQQRLQSLLLALGGDSWGFRLSDSEWMECLCDKNTLNTGKGWSKASLCVNVEKLLNEFNRCQENISRISVEKVLAWAVIDHSGGYGNRNENIAELHEYVPIASQNASGRFIRLSWIWNSINETTDSDMYKRNLQETLHKIVVFTSDEERTNYLGKYLIPLSKFMWLVANVKNTCKIDYLEINDFNSMNGTDRTYYNDAIVNIFTRLNSAGRILTAEDITLAWLKSGWRETANKDNLNTDLKKEAGKYLEELLKKLNRSESSDESSNGLSLSMDELVKILSFIWAISSNRKGVLLSSKDLLEGSTVKDIGKTLYSKWDVICMAAEDTAGHVLNSGLLNCFPYSFHAFLIATGWRYITQDWFETNFPNRWRDEENFKLYIEDSFDKFLSRWYLSTQLTGTWSNSDSLTKYSRELYQLYESLSECRDINEAKRLLVGRLDSWLENLLTPATQYINALTAYNRNQVSRYKSVLWVWNRLDSEREKNSTTPLKRKSAQPRTEVDHAVSVDIWNELIMQAFPDENTFDEHRNEIPFNINGFSEPKKRSQLLEFINNIGNTSLLIRSYNRSKSKEQFHDFLKEVLSDDGKVSNWAGSMRLTEALLKPKEVELADIIKEINGREQLIKEDVIHFLNNNKQLV